ncbi:hypothetical protein OIU78_024668 [Salix suchowensis]|nr:hypothetical protein OIU78_024668 [Salix suchowensis]
MSRAPPSPPTSTRSARFARPIYLTPPWFPSMAVARAPLKLIKARPCTEASPSSLLNLGDPAMAGSRQPVIGMFREMVYARVFGAFPNSYHLMGASSSPRLRRHELQADKSLNRISIFLFCCFLLCLIVF